MATVEETMNKDLASVPKTISLHENKQQLSLENTKDTFLETCQVHKRIEKCQ